MTNLNQDFHDLIAAFEEAGAEYLLIGGYAVSLHSKPRYTKDIDIWVGSSSENIEKVASALETFGAPPQAVEDIQTCADNEIVWFGTPPNRVDLLKQIPGVEFTAAFARKARMQIGSITASVIGIDDLVTAKEAAARPQDLIDAAALRRK